MAALFLKGVGKKYSAENYVIRNLNLEINDGELMVFVGPSGCGKTTLLRMIAGLEYITEGIVCFDGEVINDLPPIERGVAMVFQSYALYPHMTVAENMGFALKMAGATRVEQQAAVQQVAEVLQITSLLKRKPKELSGGQRQRVAIGRAIVRKPKVFLFDEPLSNLDANLRVQMRVELSRLHQELGTTMIYVTHDQVEAMTLGQRISVFNSGRIEQVGTPLDLYHRPSNLFVAEFMGSPKINILQVAFERQSNGQGVVRVFSAGILSLGNRFIELSSVQSIGIRPEDFNIVSAGQGISAIIGLIEQLGDSTVLYCRINGCDKDVAVRLNGSVYDLTLGKIIELGCDPKKILLFDAAGKVHIG